MVDRTGSKVLPDLVTPLPNSKSMSENESGTDSNSGSKRLRKLNRANKEKKSPSGDNVNFGVCSALCQAKIHRMFLTRGYMKLMSSVMAMWCVVLFPLPNENDYYSCKKIYLDVGGTNLIRDVPLDAQGNYLTVNEEGLPVDRPGSGLRLECEDIHSLAITRRILRHIQKPELPSGSGMMVLGFVIVDVVELLAVYSLHASVGHFWFMEHYINAPLTMARLPPDAEKRWQTVYVRLAGLLLWSGLCFWLCYFGSHVHIG